MPIDEQWDRLSDADWDAFAQEWIAALGGSQADSDNNVLQSVVLMNFTARPEHQWQFILAATRHSSDEELADIAAGPLEHLLGKHGEKYIANVERQAQADSKFLKMLSGVWRYTMSDAVWARVEALKTTRRRG